MMLLLAFIYLSYLLYFHVSSGMKMVDIGEEPGMTRVIASYTSMSRVQCALRCKRHDGCTDIAVTDGKLGVCYL